ncbi:DNA polymerase IV [Vulgatibacter sp.]|uniref:DNA polymerase IV n=1 Tax=Vulgatibacter sp. TaxID=1971226 RepID=UPI00356A4B00
MEAPGRQRWPRIIVHADMDAFFAAVEQLDHPELRGKPVIVGHPGERSVVTTASYEARPFGVGSAMPMAQAMRRCPDAIVVPPRFSRYAEISRQVMETFATFSPRVEALSLDEAFLDMSGAEKLFGPPPAIARRIKDAVRAATGLNVSVGVASTKFVAKVASDHRKPDGLTVVPPEEVAAFLHPMKVGRLWGVGPKAEERLQRLGLRTVGDVAHASRSFLEAQLGSMGVHLHRLAWGDDPREVVPDREAKSIGAEETLARDALGVEAIRPWLLALSDKLAFRLRKAGLRAGGLRVKLKTADFQLHTRQVVLQRPTDAAPALFEAALRLLPAFDLGEPMRLVGLAAYDLRTAGAAQGDLFAAPVEKKQSALDRALDDVRAKFGNAAVRRASELP